MGLRFVALAMMVLACWSASGTQHIAIYKYDADRWPPHVSNSVRIWDDGKCTAPGLFRTYCSSANAAGIATDVAETYGMMEEPVGVVGEDGSATIRFIVHDHASQPPSYSLTQKAIYLPIADAATWDPESGKGTSIHREMGRAFFDKNVGSKRCEGAECDRATLEHWGVEEGFARIVADVAGDRTGDGNPSVQDNPPAKSASTRPVPDPAAPRQAPPYETEVEVPARPDEGAVSSEPDVAAPCEGCLGGNAALDVVETLLLHLGTEHLDIRAEVYADIPWLTYTRRSAPLPPGLKSAPRAYSFGSVLPDLKGTEAEDTWVVWYQIAWMPRDAVEGEISAGHFPPEARSWPPLKVEDYLLVNARTGELDATTLYELTRDNPRSQQAKRLARQRARDLLASAKAAGG